MIYSTVYETVSTVLVDATTKVDTQLLTVSESTTAETKTVYFTVKASTTVATETQLVTAFETVVAATETQLTTVTTTKAEAVGLKIRQDKGQFPEYATSACKDFADYSAACGCAGVKATTVTAPTPSTTVSVTETVRVQSTALSTAVATETVTIYLTETVSQPTTDVELLTATVEATTTETSSVTTTVSATVTQTVSTCLKGAALGPFKASITEVNSNTYFMYANLLNGLTGGFNWQVGSTSTASSIQNRYIWSLDEQGRLYLANNVPPYNYNYYAYMSTYSSGSNWPQIGTQQSVAAQIANGASITYLTGCVDSVTGELTLNAGGRTHILWCGAQMWMSYSKGEDINRGTCIEVHPHVAKPN
jgi:hypothetical protein